jgi:hypothetical protein
MASRADPALLGAFIVRVPVTDTGPPSEPEHQLLLRPLPGEPSDCPFPATLLTQHVGFSGMALTPDESARCLAARRLPLTGVVERIAVRCSPVVTRLPEGSRPAYPVRARHHVELGVGGHCVHIEALAQELAGPGGTNMEVRVYVDGVLKGRSILLGRLGGTINTFPVLATISPGVMMTVTPLRWTDLQDLTVEVGQRRSRVQP